MVLLWGGRVVASVRPPSVLAVFLPFVVILVSRISFHHQPWLTIPNPLNLPIRNILLSSNSLSWTKHPPLPTPSRNAAPQVILPALQMKMSCTLTQSMSLPPPNLLLALVRINECTNLWSKLPTLSLTSAQHSLLVNLPPLPRHWTMLQRAPSLKNQCPLFKQAPASPPTLHQMLQKW